MSNTNVSPTAGSVKQGGVSFIGLLGMVIGATIASAVFSFSGDFAKMGAGTGAVLLGWLITGVGMLGLCMAFYYLSVLKPDMRGGIYSYAKAGFGSYVGFNSAWGYWLSELLSNISFLTLLFAAVGQFLPLFGVGNNIPAVIGMSTVLWVTIFLVLKGAKEATAINLVATIAKISPILILIVTIMVARAFSFETFMENFFTEAGGMSFKQQVMATTTTTVWAFTGIEGAVAISGRAKRTSDVGRATVIGFLSVLVLYIIISVLSMGVMSRTELAALGNPPLAGILKSVVGPWGAALVNVAVIISLLGATLGHMVMCVECPYEAANAGAFCKAFKRTNKNGAPLFSIILTSIIAQIFLVLLYFNSSTYQVFYFFATGMIMVPYFLSAMYFLKVALKQGNRLIKAVGIFTALYSVWMIYAAGINVMLATILLYIPGVFVYAKGQKEKGLKVFETTADKAVFGVMLILLAVTIYFMATGRINPFG